MIGSSESNHSKPMRRRPIAGLRHIALTAAALWFFFGIGFALGSADLDAGISAERAANRNRSEVTSMQTFYANIRRFVIEEIDAANRAEARDDAVLAFKHLERAHILGQSSTFLHVLVHWKMFCWGWHHHEPSEVIGQLWRMVAAAATTHFGLLPTGNTGGSNVSGFKRMTVPADLQAHLDASRSS